MAPKPSPEPANEPNLIEAQSQETLLDLSAGVATSKSGETLLSLNSAQDHGSVVQRLEQLSGSERIEGVQLESSPASNARTRSSASAPEKGFTERMRSASAPAGRYEPKSELGRGGMGVVLRVRDADLRRDVAMKVLRPDRADSQSQSSARELRRFVEEAQITGQLEHPGIVPVHELGCDAQGRVFFTMKMVRGQSLSEVMRKLRAGDLETLRSYPFDRLLTAFLKICEALSFAHAHQVIHRDLKPANVMLGNFGEVLVMDWGLARVLNHARSDEPDSVKISIETDSTQRRAAAESGPEFTLDGTVVGTPAYMAPEQARGQLSRIDARTDVFALGAMLYEMLCLRPPYEADGTTQIIETAASGLIANPLTRAAKDPTIRYRLGHLPGSKIPRELDAVVMRALATNQDERYLSVLELKHDIENFMAGRPVSVRRDPVSVRLAKWVRRHPTLATSGTAAVAVVLIAAAIIAVLTANASMREAEQQQSLLASEKKARSESDTRMQAEIDRARAEKQAMAAFEEKAKVEAQAKEAAMAREKALMKRAEAGMSYNLGRDQASRARRISEPGLSRRALDVAEASFLAALASDSSFAEASFELGNLYKASNDPRCIERFVQADELQRKSGGAGDPRALVYAGDASREILRDFAAAARFYERAAAVNPDDVYARVGMGFTALLLGNFDAALLLAAQAENMDPTLWEPWHLEGTIYASEFDHTHAKQNVLFDPDLAIKSMTEAIIRCRDNGILFNERGTGYLAVGRLDEAEKDFQRARDLMPWSYAPQSNLVSVHYRRKQFQEGADLATRVLKDFPEAFELWTELGVCLLAMENFQGALNAFLQSLEVKPGRIVPLCNAALASRYLKQYEQARDYARQALALNPQYALAWHQLGLAERELGKHEDAAASFQKSFEFAPQSDSFAGEYFTQLGYLKRWAEVQRDAALFVQGNPQVATGYYWLGRAELALGRTEQAKAALKDACELSPAWEDAFERYVNLLLQLSLVEEMKAVATARSALDPKFRSAWFALGLSESILGNKKAALEAYLKALEADPEYERALVGAAEACNDLGRFAEAKVHAQKLTTLVPLSVPGRFQLGRALEGLGEYEAAIATYEQVEKLVGKPLAVVNSALDRTRRLARVAAMGKESRGPKDAQECSDLAWVETYMGRPRHASAWTRKLFAEHGQSIKDQQLIYFCAWIEMSALQALRDKKVEKAPESPKPPPLEETEEGYMNHCVALLRRLLELGFDLEELKLDLNFNPVKQTEAWKKLLKDFEKK